MLEQSEQDAAPAVKEYVPAVQAAQADDPTPLAEPALHATHVLMLAAPWVAL